MGSRDASDGGKSGLSGELRGIAAFASAHGLTVRRVTIGAMVVAAVAWGIAQSITSSAQGEFLVIPAVVGIVSGFPVAMAVTASSTDVRDEPRLLKRTGLICATIGCAVIGAAALMALVHVGAPWLQVADMVGAGALGVGATTRTIGEVDGR